MLVGLRFDYIEADISLPDFHLNLHLIIIIIVVGFIECKIDTNPLMRLSPRKESPGTDMG